MSDQNQDTVIAIPKPKRVSTRALLGFIIIFAGIGIYLLISGFASTPVIASLQAEQMTLPAGASKVADSTASGGQAVKLTQNGSLRGQVSLPSTATSLSVTVKGTKCQSGWSRISLNIDGNTVIPWTRTSSTSWQNISASGLSVAAGIHTITIGQNNSTACGRYLYVDVTNFYGPTPPPPATPTVSISATPTSVVAGQSSTLTWSSTNTTSCTGSSSWSGSKPTSGTTSTGAINANSIYNLSCTGAGGTAAGSATVTVTGGSGGGGGSTTLNTVSNILNSMGLPNEGSPHNFGYPFPSLSYVTPPLPTYVPAPGFNAVGPWGQIYVDSGNVMPANLRVEVKNLEEYLWSKSQNKWIQVIGNLRPLGSHYPENFSGSPVPASLRTEPDGGLSSTMIAGYNFHFYTGSHPAMTDPTDIGAAFVTCQARLILDSSTGPNNISQARYLVSVGSDRWSTSSSVTWNGSHNPSVGGGRFTYLTGNWQATNFYTGGPSTIYINTLKTYPQFAQGAWTQTQLQSNPPPLDAMGLP